jgi:hypothetical protein
VVSILAAWTPPVQPTSHPNDEDLSLGTPDWTGCYESLV